MLKGGEAETGELREAGSGGQILRKRKGEKGKRGGGKTGDLRREMGWGEFVLSFCSQMHYGPRMKTVCLTIRDCPAEVHRALSERAAAHKRSLNSETIVVLENALEARRMSEAELRRAIRSIPTKARLSLAEMRAAIREGRK